MRMMTRGLLIILVSVLTLTSALAYPTPSNDPNNIVPNQWTHQLEAAKTKAQQLNRPLMMAFVDTVTCSKCRAWSVASLDTAAWASFSEDNPMILVWVDRSFNLAVWDRLKAPYIPFGFPMVLMFSPNGDQVDRFEATGSMGRADGFIARVGNTTRRYPYETGPGTISLSTSAATVSEAAGTFKVSVTRADGSAGIQTVSYRTVDGSAKAGTDYTTTSGSFTWANGDTSTKTFNIPLIDNNRWTSPTERRFAVSLTKTAGNAALGTTLQTVTITESTPFVAGLLGFTTASGSVVEGATYALQVSRTAGASGAASVAVSVSGGYTVSPTTLTWADGNSAAKTVTVSGIAATANYDPRSFTVSLARTSGDVMLGQKTHQVSVLDQAVTQTFAAYIANKPVFKDLVQEEELWFFNQAVAALRTEPLNNNARAVLAWTAPKTGRLRFTWGQNANVAQRLTQEPGVAANVAPAGTFRIMVGGQTTALSATSATETVGVRAGDVVRWVAQGAGGDYVAMLSGLTWEALAPVSGVGVSPVNGRMLQVDDVRANQNLVNLTWQAGPGNPAGAVQRLYAGATAASLTAKGVVGSGANAVRLGIVTLAAAQGGVYWRIDTELPSDYGKAVAVGPVWTFSIIDLPSFHATVPAAGSTVNAFRKAGAVIPAGAASATPVTYTATGLPRGMSINPDTGEITGTASQTGTSTVTVTATNREGVSTRTFTIVVETLPPHTSGSFQGIFIDEDGVLAGTMQLRASRSGRLSARLDTDNARVSLRGEWLTGGGDGTFLARLENRSGDVLELTLTADGVLSGTYEGLTLLGRAPTVAGTAPFVGYYTSLLQPEVMETGSSAVNNRPAGSGYLTFTISRSGRVRYSGYLADGTRLSGSATVLAFNGAEMRTLGYTSPDPAAQYAVFPFFKSIYRRRGLAGGLCWILANDVLNLEDNEVWIDNSAWVYPGLRTTSPEDSFRATFNGTPAGAGTFSPNAQRVGGLYARSQDFTASYGNAELQVDESGIALEVSSGALKLPRDNPANASISTRVSSGLFSGRLIPSGARRTKFKGVLVPYLNSGAGFYLVDDPVLAQFRLKRSLPVVVAGGTQPIHE